MTLLISTLCNLLTTYAKHIILAFSFSLIATVFPCRLKRSVQIVHFVVFLLLLGGLFRYYDSIYFGQYSFFLFNVLIILCSLLFSAGSYGYSFLKKALLLTVFLSYVALVRFLFNTAIRSLATPFPIFESRSLCNLVIDLCVYTVTCLIWCFLVHLFKIRIFHWKKSEITFITLFSVLNLLAISYLSAVISGNSNTLTIIFTYANLLFVNLILFYLFVRFTKTQEQHLELQKTLQNMEMQKVYLAQMKEAAAQMHELRHELHNYMFYIEQLVNEKRYDELEAYVAHFNCIQHSIPDLIDCGNPVISALLNQKRAYADSLNIATDIQVILPPSLTFDEADLCSLISNLFSNGVEHCEHLEHAKIYIEIKPVKHYLSLVFQNSVSHDILEENPSLQTTKKDPACHGIGLKVVKNIVKKYDGMLNFQMLQKESLMFVVQCMLKFQ